MEEEGPFIKYSVSTQEKSFALHKKLFFTSFFTSKKEEGGPFTFIGRVRLKTLPFIKSFFLLKTRRVQPFPYKLEKDFLLVSLFSSL